MEYLNPRKASKPSSFRREQLLAMADAHFSCFSVEHREPSHDMRLLTEHFQDVTDEMCAYLEAVLKMYGVTESLGSSGASDLGDPSREG